MIGFCHYRNANERKSRSEKLFPTIIIFPTIFKFEGNRSHQGVRKSGRNRVE